MAKEIKIQFEEAEQVLNKLKAQANGIKLSLPAEIAKENKLEVIDQLNEINSALKQLVVNYQTYLSRNEAAAKEVLKDMKEFEKVISSQFLIK